MEKLMIASPCHHGKIDTIFALSLIGSLYVLDSKAKIQTIVLLPATGSILAKERNNIIQAFMKSDCTHLLCVDSDIGWTQADAPLKFLNHDKDIVVGVYPARSNRPDKKYIFSCDTDENERIKTDGKLLKMLYAPAGFMMISRICIKTMQEKLPELYYEGVDIDGIKESGYIFFNTELKDGKFWGEDYIFCENARKAGIDIWCDPTIEFNHAGTVGKFEEILTNKRPMTNGTFNYKTDTKLPTLQLNGIL